MVYSTIYIYPKQTCWMPDNLFFLENFFTLLFFILEFGLWPLLLDIAESKLQGHMLQVNQHVFWTILNFKMLFFI